tara:strand:+ start:1038 stop:1247 length:210 start_codon:yes stop_codon:yes gene_type:complete
MSLIGNMLKQNKEEIIDSIFNDELKAKVVKALNDNIDVPFISEETEGKILDSLYSSVEDIVKQSMKDQL